MALGYDVFGILVSDGFRIQVTENIRGLNLLLLLVLRQCIC